MFRFPISITLCCALGLLLGLAVQAFAGSPPVVDREELLRRVEEQRGRPVLVNFWATWCAPCKKELPGLKQLRGNTPGEALAMIGVSLDYDPAALERFLKDHPLNYPVYIADPNLMRDMGVESIPKTLFFDAEGREALTHSGLLSEEELRRIVGELAP